jgi:hypothetical protein
VITEASKRFYVIDLPAIWRLLAETEISRGESVNKTDSCCHPEEQSNEGPLRAEEGLPLLGTQGSFAFGSG